MKVINSSSSYAVAVFFRSVVGTCTSNTAVLLQTGKSRLPTWKATSPSRIPPIPAAISSHMYFCRSFTGSIAGVKLPALAGPAGGREAAGEVGRAAGAVVISNLPILAGRPAMA